MTPENTQIIRSVLNKVVNTDNAATCLYRKYPTNAPWCMAGIQYLLRELFNIKELPDTNSCTDFYHTIPASRRNHSYSTAEPGDLILYQGFDDIDGDYDHVGIVYSNDTSTKTLQILEANHGTNENRFNSWGFRTCGYSYPYFGCVVDMSDLMIKYCEHEYKPYTTNPPKKLTEEEFLEIPRQSIQVDSDEAYDLFLKKLTDYINTRAISTISVNDLLSFLKGEE